MIASPLITAFGSYTSWLCVVDMMVDFSGNADGLAITVSSMTASVVAALRRRRGRPRKFNAPSRAVTLTLPETVLEQLARIHSDLSRAVVQLAGRRAPENGRPPAELAVFGNRAVITVKPTASLEHRAGLHLVPLPDGRALLSFDQPRTIADLELVLFDALDDPRLSEDDRKVFEAIGAILKEARRSEDVTLVRRNIVVLESTRGARGSKHASGLRGSKDGRAGRGSKDGRAARGSKDAKAPKEPKSAKARARRRPAKLTRA